MTTNAQERPHRGRAVPEILHTIRDLERAIRTHNRYLDDIDNKYRGMSPGPELYAGEVELINGLHRDITALRLELDLRAKEWSQTEQQRSTVPAEIVGWLGRMEASPTTRVDFTWTYKGNRFFGISQMDGSVQVWVQVPRNAASEKLGPTWVLPANNKSEYHNAMKAAGWNNR